MNAGWQWVCKDGRFLHVENMRTGHIQNTLAMLGRNAPYGSANEFAHTRQEWIAIFLAELRRRKRRVIPE